MGISVMNADGSKKVFITPRYRAVGYPAWSPDGKQIAFIENHSFGYLPDGEKEILHIANSDGSRLVSLFELSELLTNKDRLTWSSDGTKITLSATRAHTYSGRGSKSDIYLYDLGDARFTRLPSDDHKDFSPAWYPTWSPDGQRLAFVSEGREHRSEIFVMNVDGSEPQRVTTIPRGDSCWAPCGPISPRWSPDGTKLAYTLRGINSPEHREVHVVQADGSGDIRLMASGVSGEQPAWSPDGKRLVLASIRGGFSAIYLVNLDGSGLTPLTKHEDNASYPQWLPGEEKIVFVQGGELYLMNPDGSRQIRLDATATGINDSPPFACAPR